MAFMLLIPSFTFASSNSGVKTEVDNSIVTVDNQKYEVSLKEDGESIISIVTNEQGTIQYTKNKATDVFTVSSDFLTDAELKEVTNQANSAVVELNEDIDDNELLTSSNLDLNKSKSMMEMAKASSSWKKGKWKNYKITANGKFTTQTVIGVLGAAFGFTGAAVAGAANIMIQYGVKTGYFKVRRDYKILSGSYMLRRDTVKTYKNSKRTILLGTSTGEKKIWIGN